MQQGVKKRARMTSILFSSHSSDFLSFLIVEDRLQILLYCCYHHIAVSLSLNDLRDLQLPCLYIRALGRCEAISGIDLL